MPTVRAIAGDLENALEFLRIAELAHVVNGHTPRDTADGATLTWTPWTAEPFLRRDLEGRIELYRYWVQNGHYSAVLLDGSLLQISYDFHGSDVVGHRLAYIPCPVTLDRAELRDEDILEAVDLQLDVLGVSAVALGSALRFDYDPGNAKPGHPASHMTLNSPACRIACIEAMHLGRFLDLVFRHFYAPYWSANRAFFDASSSRGIGGRVLSEDDENSPHISWRSRSIA